MRIDEFLFVKGYFDSRNKAKTAINKGMIRLDGNKVEKPSLFIEENSSHKIEVDSVEFFVSLGGYKLSKALTDFEIRPEGLICADIGASTGGFTDCLIKNGANKVYAVDVNCKQLHDSLKSNEKVIPLEKNVKSLTANDFNDKLDLIVADLSFISAKSVLNVLDELLDFNKTVILLIKPQFEIGEKRKFKNGIIKSAEIRKKTCKSVYDCAVNTNLRPIAATVAPICQDKNVEYLLLLKKDGSEFKSFDKVFSDSLF